MKTIKLSNGKVVQVSEKIYISDNQLYRKIGGLKENKPEPGYHYDNKEGWYCFIPLRLCYNGTLNTTAYIGINENNFEEFYTHNLNHKG